jgi:predicted ester cyclase
MSEANKAVVTRLVTEVLNGGDLGVIDDLYAPDVAAAARKWITPFRRSFPDVRMEILDLIAERDRVVGRFTCSATQSQPWLGHPPTGRRFEDVAEISIFRFENGRIAETWTVEDNLDRLTQLGLLPGNG